MVCTFSFDQTHYTFLNISQHLLFDEYRIESLNNGEIAFKINCNDLNRALKSALEASEVIMKLTKKGNDPFLNFQIQKVCFLSLLSLCAQLIHPILSIYTYIFCSSLHSLVLFLLQMSMHNNVILLQDIPVEILTAAQIASYVEPNLADPEVSCLCLCCNAQLVMQYCRFAFIFRLSRK